MPTVGQYAFNVLLRQVKRARKAFGGTGLHRCTPAGKTVRADMFRFGRVTTVDAHVSRLARANEEVPISAYLKKQCPDLRQLELRNRADQKVDEYLLRVFHAGLRAGANVRLQHGVETERSHVMIECAH